MLDELPQLSCEKLDDRANKLRKYHVLIEAEGAGGWMVFHKESLDNRATTIFGHLAVVLLLTSKFASFVSVQMA